MKRGWLLGLILAAPILGIGVSEGLRASFNSDLRASFKANASATKPVPDAFLSRLTVDLFCERVGHEAGGGFCDTVGYLRLMRNASIAAAALGLFLLGLIYLAGRASRRRRELLATLFVPGLRGTIAVVLLLVVVHAGVLMGAIYYGESALIGRVHVFLIGGIGFAAIAAVYAVAKSSFGVVRRAQVSVLGTAVSRDDCPRLWARVEEIAERIGALMPTNIILGLDPNFFVTEANVETPENSHAGRTLYCSVPLMRILSPEETDSILAHELGHFVGRDVEFSRRFYPVYRGTSDAMDALYSSTEGGLSSVAVLPAAAVLSYFFECFAVAESEIGRERELEADRHGANVAGVAATASALVKVHAFAGVWNTIVNSTAELIEKGATPPNTSLAFASEVARTAGAAAFEDLAQAQLVHPTDTHPPLVARLEALGTTLDEVADRALLVAPKPSAASLVANLEGVEKALSDLYNEALAEERGIDLEEPIPANAPSPADAPTAAAS